MEIMDQETIKALKDYEDDRAEKDRESNRIKRKILKEVKPNVTKKKYAEILEIIRESDYTYNFKIADSPKGEFQIGGNYWCDQKVGYECDDYSGTVSVEVDKGRFLQFNYQMQYRQL